MMTVEEACRARDVAIKIGEESTNDVIRIGTMLLRHRRGIKTAITLLDVGRINDAKDTLQMILTAEKDHPWGRDE